MIDSSIQFGPIESVFTPVKTLSIMLTYRCNAECNDCGTFSSPRDKNHLNLEDVLLAIEEAKQLGFANVVFTGGETTLEWDNLVTAIAFARSLQLPVRIVTNGHWAHTPDIARDRLQILIDAGLTELNLSTGDEHLRFVPATSVVHGVVAGLHAGIQTCLMFELRNESKSTPAAFVASISSAVSERELLTHFRLITSPWMPMRYDVPSPSPANALTTRSNLHQRPGCESLLQTYVLRGDGKISSCCGLGMRVIPELQVGRIGSHDSLRSAIDEASNDWLKVAIHKLGPERILAWAADKNPSIEWEGRHSHRCHACLRIYRDPEVRNAVQKHFYELLSDVVFATYLDRHVLPEIAPSVA